MELANEATEHKWTVSWLLDLQNELAYTEHLGIGSERVRLDLQTIHVPIRVRSSDGAPTLMGAAASVGEFRLFTCLSDPDRVFDWLQDAVLHHLALVRKFNELRSNVGVEAQVIGEAPQVSGLTGDGNGLAGGQLDAAVARALVKTHILLLGDAGSGKTTTLRYAALTLAKAWPGDTKSCQQTLATNLGLHVNLCPIPVYARLALLGPTLPAELDALPLAERSRYLGAPTTVLFDWLDTVCAPTENESSPLSERIRCNPAAFMLLLDGLDECGTESKMQFVAMVLENTARKFPELRILVSSRPGSRIHALQLGSFARFRLAPLNRQEIHALVEKWFTALMGNLGGASQSANFTRSKLDGSCARSMACPNSKLWRRHPCW